MNANELMIGDWVQYDVNAWRDDEYDRKCCVPDYQPFKIESGEELDKLILDDGKPKPIPLTPELLTNNGFTLENKNKYPRRYRLNLNTHCGDYIIVDFDCYNQLSKKNWSFPIQMCMLVGNDRFCENFVRIYQYDYLYVHQLQHALRLAGINKEIVL